MTDNPIGNGVNNLKLYFDEKYSENKQNIENFDILKKKFLYFFQRKGDILENWMKILPMIYYCLFLIAITFAGVSMMFYACLKRQGYLLTFMHVLWNIIRFFMFSFFIFGAFYGIIYLILKDLITVIYRFFTPGIIDSQNEKLLPKGTNNNGILQECLKEKNFNFKSKMDKKIVMSLEDFFNNYYELSKLNISEDLSKFDEFNDYIQGLRSKFDFGNLPETAGKIGGLFGSFNCGFLESYLYMIYRALNDASKEAEYLSALSLCSSFFGAVSIYFYLLVLHHYNNELFFDGGKSIFKGFDGFGSGYKMKNKSQDPAYKKRKLRAEIELTSKNDEVNIYKDINKNEDNE